jgi:hypothetical protein
MEFDMKIKFGELCYFVVLLTWMMGIVYAFEIGTMNGIIAIFTGPFYAWYLVTKNIMIYLGILHGCF